MNPFTRPVKVLPFVPIASALLFVCSAQAGVIDPNIVVIYSATVVNTPFPNWALGDPQAAAVGVCSVLVGNCGNFGGGPLENRDGIALLTAPATFGAFTQNGDTFVQEGLGVVGADVRVPTAWWLAPAVYTWAGGGVAFFNSIVGGVAFANELVVFDPPPDPYTTLQDLSVDLGAFDPLPSANTSISPNSDGTVDVPAPSFEEAPEPASLALLGLGSGLLMLRRLFKNVR